MDSVFLYNKEVPISYDLWIGLSKRLDWLSKHWREPDEGIWEIAPRQRFTYSALMTWVAYDRAARLARDRGLPAPVERWRKLAPRRTGSFRSPAGTRSLRTYVHVPGQPAHSTRRCSSCPWSSSRARPTPGSSPPSTRSRRALSPIAWSTLRHHRHGRHRRRRGHVQPLLLLVRRGAHRAGRLREARMVFEKMLTYANTWPLRRAGRRSGEALATSPRPSPTWP